MATQKLGTPTGVIVRIDDVVTLTNSTTETTLLSYVIPAGSLNMCNEFIFNLYFSVTTKLLTPGTLTIKLKYGSGVLTLGGGALNLVANIANSPFKINGALCNKNNNSNQFIEGEIRQGGTAITLATPVNMAYSNLAIDSTTDRTFVVTAQFSVADPTNTLVTQRIKAELA